MWRTEAVADAHAHVAIDWDKDLAFVPVDSELVVGMDAMNVDGGNAVLGAELADEALDRLVDVAVLKATGHRSVPLSITV